MRNLKQAQLETTTSSDMSNASTIGAADGARTENGKINKARQGASALCFLLVVG